MGYNQIWIKYKIQIIAMGAFVAWLWFFPLFGIMQTSFLAVEGKITIFNLVFLGSKILGFVLFLLIRKNQNLWTFIPLTAPVAALSTWLTAIIALQYPTQVFLTWKLPTLAVFLLLPVIAGLASALFFAFWGTTIFYISHNTRGRYMAAMVASATILYTLLVVIFDRFPLIALFLSGFILLIPSISINTVISFIKAGKEKSFHQTLPVNNILLKHKHKNPWKAFWLPFSLTILCFYILAWATHDIIFSTIKEESILLSIIGQGIYAVMFIIAGYYLDRQEKIELIAVMGLVLLGCSFLLLPVVTGIDLLWSLYYLLEGSYGLIDLFMWVGLAYFCQLLAGEPDQYYGQGLLLNILFIIAGIVLMPLFNVVFHGINYLILSVTAGIILFVGVLPTLFLRNLRQERHELVLLSDIIQGEIEKINMNPTFTIEQFTQKEKEIVYLMLSGYKNPEIVDKIGISKNTLKTHVRNIYSKADVQNRTELLFKFADQIKNNTNTE